METDRASGSARTVSPMCGVARRSAVGEYNARLVDLREGLDNLKRIDPEDR